MIKVRLNWANSSIKADEAHKWGNPRVLESIAAFVETEEKNGYIRPKYNVEVPIRDRYVREHFELEIESLEKLFEKSIEPLVIDEYKQGIYYVIVYNGYLE